MFNPFSKNITKKHGSFNQKASAVMMDTLEWSWRRKYFLLGIFCLCFLFFSMQSYISSLSSARVIMSLNYEQASAGLNPNDTRFNIYEMKNEEVMEKVLEYAGLKGKASASELSSCISIAATNSRGTDYISTSYKITFRNNTGFANRSSEDILNLICKAYKDYFMENYADNQAILSFSTNDLGENEYLMVSDLISLRATQLLTYVTNRQKQIKNYTDDESGISYNSLQDNLENFLAYDAVNLKAYILEHGIAANKADIISILQYRQRLNRKEYEEDMAYYHVDNEGIGMYDEAMSSIVMIPTEDTSNEYYMSRTKTAMDELAVEADEHLAAAQQTDYEIEQDEYVIEKFSTVMPTKENIEKTDAMIAQMWEQLDTIAKLLRQLDTSYLHYRTKEYLTFKGEGLTFRNRLNLSGCIIRALLVMLVIFMLRYIITIRKLIRKNRRELGDA